MWILNLYSLKRMKWSNNVILDIELSFLSQFFCTVILRKILGFFFRLKCVLKIRYKSYFGKWIENNLIRLRRSLINFTTHYKIMFVSSKSRGLWKRGNGSIIWFHLSRTIACAINNFHFNVILRIFQIYGNLKKKYLWRRFPLTIQLHFFLLLKCLELINFNFYFKDGDW